VEKNAGKATHFFDEKFAAAGATVLHSHEEIFGRSDVIVKSDRLMPEELDLIREEQILMGFHHLAVSDPNIVKRLVEQKATVIGYELIEDEDGVLPVLYPTSEIAGQMSVQVASEFMKISRGGKGIVLGGIPGVPPAVIVILGAVLLDATHAWLRWEQAPRSLFWTRTFGSSGTLNGSSRRMPLQQLQPERALKKH